LGTNKILLELVATATNSDVINHFHRATSDAPALNIQEAYVIHFTVNNEEQHKYPFPEPTEMVKAIHVWHDCNFTHCKLVHIEKGDFKEDIQLQK